MVTCGVAVVTGASGLEWRVTGTDDWSQFAGENAGEIYLSGAKQEELTYPLDLRLRIESDEPPGSFRARLVFSLIDPWLERAIAATFEAISGWSSLGRREKTVISTVVERSPAAAAQPAIDEPEEYGRVRSSYLVCGSDQ